MAYYLRVYQRMVRTPGLDWVVNKLSSLTSPFILAQDVYVKSDRAVIEYLKWREGLQRT